MVGARERKDTEDLKYLGVFGAWWGSGRLAGTAGCTQCHTPPGVGEVGVGMDYMGLGSAKVRLGKVD